MLDVASFVTDSAIGLGDETTVWKCVPPSNSVSLLVKCVAHPSIVMVRDKVGSGLGRGETHIDGGKVFDGESEAEGNKSDGGRGHELTLSSQAEDMFFSGFSQYALRTGSISKKIIL